MKKSIIFLAVFLYALIYPKTISHRSIVNDIEIIDNKIYSVSNDNTLKCWDRSLNLEDTVYEKQNDYFGNLYTIAGNKKYILTAGIVGNDNVVFVHNKKLEVIKLLRHNFNAINKLRFSLDKKLLVVLSSDGLYFYDKNLKFLYSESFYDYNKKYCSFYDVVFLNNHKIAFVNWDGYVIVYDVKSKKILNTKKLPTRLQSVDFVNNKIYAGGYDGYLYVLDKNLNILKKILIGLNFEILQIKHSKNYIALAGGNGGFAVLENDKVLFKKETGFSKAIAIDKDDIYVGSGRIVLHYKFKNFENKTKTIIFYPDSITIKSPYFSLNYDEIYNNFIGNSNKNKFQKINNQWYGYKITTTNLKDDSLIIFKKDGVKKIEVAEFIRDNSSGYRHRVVLWYKHYIISGGDYGYVFIYDVKSKTKVAELSGLKDHIVDLVINGNILAVLDKRGDIRLYNLSKLSKNINPYLTITLFKDKSFLIRSGNYFYTNDIKKVILLKPTRLNFKKVTSKPDKAMIEKIISLQKIPETIKTIKLTSNIPSAIDTDINYIFNTSKYIILGDVHYYAMNKQTKKIKKLPVYGYIVDVLEKGGFIFVLLREGNVYKFDSDFNFVAKTTFKPVYFGKKSRFLSSYKKDFIAFRHKNTIYILDTDLNLRYKLTVPTKNLYFWTFIGDKLFLYMDYELIKVSFSPKSHSSIKVDRVYLKTPQNKLVIKRGNFYYLVDEDFNTKKLLISDYFDFYKGKKFFYALSGHKIIKFLDNKIIKKAILKKRIDYLAGIAEIGKNVAIVVDRKLMLFDFKTKKLKLLTQPVVNFFDMYVGDKFIVAESDKFIYIYDKNFKLIKKLHRNDSYIYVLKNNKIYIKAYSGYKYAIDLNTFKKFEVSKFPKTIKTKAYYSDTDGYMYYGRYFAKAKERIFKIFETKKYIVAWGVGHNLYVYDKKLNLIKKIVLDKRVNALYVTKKGILYYAIYDNLFKFKI